MQLSRVTIVCALVIFSSAAETTGDTKRASASAGGVDEEAQSTADGEEETLTSSLLVSTFENVAIPNPIGSTPWVKYTGFLGETSTMHEDEMPLADAFKYCEKEASCASFSFNHNDVETPNSFYFWFKDNSTMQVFSGAPDAFPIATHACMLTLVLRFTDPSKSWTAYLKKPWWVNPDADENAAVQAAMKKEEL
jgi:hypothetical protein